mgnify:CR=1 FL=1
MKKVLTIGGATQDVFLESSEIISKNLEISGISKRFLLIPESEKIDISAMHYAIGGGSTNCAASFQKLGFEVEAFFKIGYDESANFVIKYLESKNINISNISRSKDLKTGISFILPSQSGERTVLVYRGASASLSEADIADAMFFKKDLVYIAPLSEESGSVLCNLIKLAKTNGSLVAVNPSKWQLSHNAENLKIALKDTDIFIVNRRESQVLSLKLFNQELSIFNSIKKILEMGPKIAVITDGKSGVYVGFEDKVIFHESLKTKVINTVGAGDAFASCFVGSLINFGISEESIKKSIVYGLINSSSVISFHDAKEGLLDSDQIESKFKSIGISSFKVISN